MFAGAAFPDQADINEVNADAVDTLSALGVIDGYADGTFRPNETVTRAQMAKMIYIIRTNRSDASAYNDDATTFTDISDHWARGYIKYCQSLGVISGKSATRFDPDATVTTQEAAKMLLVTLGYDAEKAGLVGAGWGNKTTALADENGLLVDVECGTTQGMPRQYAAQLIYNAIFASTVQWRDDAYYNANILGNKYQTIGQKYMDLSLYEGVLYSSGKFAAGIKYGNNGVEEQVSAADVAGDKYMSIAVNTVNQTELATASRYSATLKYDKDLTDLVGETVKVLVGKNNEVYGVSASSSKNTVVETTTDVVKDWTSDSVKIDGVKYDIESDFIGKASINNNFADQVKFVDYDDNGDLDLAIVVPVGVAKVTFVGSDSVTLSKTVGNANLKASTQKLADIISYDGIAKDDYVVFQKDLYTQKDVLVKADVLEGTITGVKASEDEWQIDGNWYKLTDNGTSYDSYTPKADDGVKAVAIGSKLYFIEKTSGPASAEDVAMVVTYTGATGVEKAKAVLLLADGEKVTAEYKMTSGEISVGTLYTYTIDNDGVYELTAAATMDDYTWVAGAAGDVNLTDDTLGASTTYTIADDAVVFLINNTSKASADNEAKVITGKELKSLTSGSSKGEIATQSLGFYYSKSNGINKATIIAVKSATADSLDEVTGASSANYGYLVENAYTSKADGKDYINFKIWNGTDTVDVKWEKSGSAAAYTKHTVIGYDDLGNGLIGNVDVINLTAAALTGGAGTNDVQFNGTGDIFSIESDTVILYVNGAADDAADIGVAGGSISNALEPADGVYVQNVKYKANSSDELEVLVVDVNNKLEDRDTAVLTISGSDDVKVYVNDDEVAETADIAAGDIVKFVGGETGGTVTPNTANIIGALAAEAHTVAAGSTETYVVQSATTVTLTLGAAS